MQFGVSRIHIIAVYCMCNFHIMPFLCEWCLHCTGFCLDNIHCLSVTDMCDVHIVHDFIVSNVHIVHVF